MIIPEKYQMYTLLGLMILTGIGIIIVNYLEYRNKKKEELERELLKNKIEEEIK